MFYINSSALVTKYIGNTFSYSGTINTTLDGMDTCPGTFLISVSTSLTFGANYFLSIKSPTFNNLQSLNYLTNQVNSMDCSANYLVSIDISNFMAITTFPPTDDVYIFSSNFGRWVLWVIVGAGSLLLVVVIVIVVICCRRRRRRSGEDGAGLSTSIRDEFTMGEPVKYGNIYE